MGGDPVNYNENGTYRESGMREPLPEQREEGMRMQRAGTGFLNARALPPQPVVM